jgi:putative heme-binding domain-containing protein
VKIAAEAARAIYDDDSIPAGLPDLAALLDDASIPPTDAMHRRALNACLRLGGPENAARVIAFALREDASVALREEALEIAKVWNTPSPLDRVDGRYRIIIGTADPKMLANAALPKIEALMAVPEASLRALVVQVLTIHQIDVAAGVAKAAVLEESADPEVRIEALKLLALQHPATPELEAALTTLLYGKGPGPLRVAALETLLLSDRAAATTEAANFLKKGTTFEKQKAVAVLAKAESEEADAILLELWTSWKAGKGSKKLPAALHLELLEAAESRKAASEKLANLLDAHQQALASVAGTPEAFEECLEGGDPAAGREISRQNLAANCTACHRFEAKVGSNVGPELSQIGKQKDRAYLLAALVAPSASIPSGYGMLSVTLQDGTVLTGNLLESSSRSTTIRLPDGTERTVDAAEIASQTEPVSVMPPMGALLTKRQIRDLVAYLADLKGSSKK